MIVETSDLVGRLLATSGIWEPHVTAAFRRLLAPGDVCVDAGAHIGYFTLLASRLVGPSGHVYALEPVRTTLDALCANLELNRVGNVSVFPVAAGSRDGDELLYPAPPGNSGSAALRRRWGRVDPANAEFDPRAVPVRSISSLVKPADVSKLRLVKIDVEGYELEVLRGLDSIFDSGHRPALVVEVHGSVAHGVGEWIAELRRRRQFEAYRLLPEDTFDRSLPMRVLLQPFMEAELLSLDNEFLELLVSPFRLETRFDHSGS